MGVIQDSLDRASAATATRPLPKSAGARMRFLLRTEKGSTRAVAARLGISQRTVERYVKGTLRRPRKDLAARLEQEVRKDWQPRVRQRARKRAATSGGIVIETRARFGFTAAPGSTDDGRMRRLTQHLPPPTRPACSTRSPPAPPSSSSRRSPPRVSRRSTSRTAAAAPTTWRSSSPTSTTSNWTSEPPSGQGAGA